MSTDLPVGVQPATSPTRAWFTLFNLVFLVLFAFVDRQVIALVAVPMAATLGLSYTQVGIVQGLSFAIFTVAASYPIAWLADRIDRRIVLAGCVIVWSSGTALCGFADGFAALFFGAILIAAGEAGLWPIALSAVPDLFTGQRRTTANLIFYSASMMGAAGGFFIGGGALAAIAAWHAQLPPELQQLEPWRVAFFVVAAPAPLFVLSIVFMHLQRSKSVPIKGETDQNMWPYLRVHGRTVALVLSGITAFGVATAGMFAWIPAALTGRFAVDAAQNGFGMGTASAAGGLVGIVIAGLLMRRYRGRLGWAAAIRISWPTGLVGIPILLLLPFITAAWQGYLIMALQVACGTLSGCLIPSILQDLAPARLRARLMALYSITYIPVVSLAVMFVGLLSDVVADRSGGVITALVIIGLTGWTLGTILMRVAERPYAKTAEMVQ